MRFAGNIRNHTDLLLRIYASIKFVYVHTIRWINSLGANGLAQNSYYSFLKSMPNFENMMSVLYSMGKDKKGF